VKRWRAGCDGMISVNSLFASFALGLVGVIVAFLDKSPSVQACVFLLLIAFVIFAHAAETITDSIENDDVKQYQRSHQEYNIGVILVLVSLAIILFSLGYRIAAVIPVLGTWNPWLRDLIWLVRRPAGEWQQYIDKLTEEDS